MNKNAALTIKKMRCHAVLETSLSSHYVMIRKNIISVGHRDKQDWFHCKCFLFVSRLIINDDLYCILDILMFFSVCFKHQVEFQVL